MNHRAAPTDGRGHVQRGKDELGAEIGLQNF